MRTVLVLAGGVPVAAQVAAALPPAAHVVAADSGLHHAATLGLHVDRVVGDFDSVDPALLEAAVASGASIERHPVAKDATDLELAMEAARALDPDRVVVVGGAGGRLDHLLANVLLLASERYAHLSVEAYVDSALVAVAHGGHVPLVVRGRSGSLVSLLPVFGRARGVVTSGLAYPLAGEDLHAGSTRGASNVLAAEEARVELAEGTLLVVQPDIWTVAHREERQP
jgi:thiamine pyrophosphokinase